MSSPLKWLCCGCCGGKTSSPKSSNREKVKNEKKLRILEELRDETNQTLTKAPLDLKTPEFKDTFVIPSKMFSTDVDVFKSIGYALENQISVGSFASVLRATHLSSGLKIAVKKVLIPETYEDETKVKRNDMIREVRIELTSLSKIRHPHVVRYYSYLMIKSQNSLTFYILMHFAECGSLERMVMENGPFNEDLCRVWTAQILCGMSYMHENGIAHRDLKISNILLDNGHHILITDFGLSRLVWRKTTQQMMIMSGTFCGTPPYLAPEALRVNDNNFLDYKRILSRCLGAGSRCFHAVRKGVSLP